MDGHLVAGFALCGFMLVAAGCQSGDRGAAFGAGSAGKPATEQISASELLAYCPQVTLREGTAFFSSYAKGGQDDPKKLAYQASISDVTRSCSRANGVLTMNVAVAGRIVPGPAGAPGTIKMPIRIAVLQGEEVLYSQLHHHQVALDGSGVATQFVFNDPNVTVPIPADQSLQVFAGYDEGPPKKKPAEDAEF
jgi:hypothetical protein